MISNRALLAGLTLILFGWWLQGLGVDDPRWNQGAWGPIQNCTAWWMDLFNECRDAHWIEVGLFLLLLGWMAVDWALWLNRQDTPSPPPPRGDGSARSEDDPET